MRPLAPVLLVGALVAGCANPVDDVSGTRVGTQDQEVSVGPPVGRVVVTQRRAGFLRFPGELDSILAQDTLAQPDSLKTMAPAQAVVLTILKPDSTQGIWLSFPGSSLPPKVQFLQDVCLDLADSTDRGFELSLPGTGIAGTGIAGRERKASACIVAPSQRWTVALRPQTGTDRGVRFLDSLPLTGRVELDLTPLWRTAAGCHAQLDASGKLRRKNDGSVVCAD